MFNAESMSLNPIPGDDGEGGRGGGGGGIYFPLRIFVIKSEPQ